MLPVLARLETAPAVTVQHGVPGVQAHGHSGLLHRCSVRPGAIDPLLQPVESFMAIVLFFAEVEEHDFVHRCFPDEPGQLVGYLFSRLMEAELHAECEMGWH